MKTTELFVEQVVIGMAALATAGLLASPRMFDWLAEADTSDFAFAVVAAYLVGMVYDRVADTLMERLEKHARLTFAWSMQEKPPHRPIHFPRMNTRSRCCRPPVLASRSWPGATTL